MKFKVKKVKGKITRKLNNDFCVKGLFRIRNRVRARSGTSACCTLTARGFTTSICPGRRPRRASGRFRCRRITRSLRGRYGAWRHVRITRRRWRQRLRTRARREMARAIRSNRRGSVLNPIRFSGTRAMLFL